LLKSKIRNTNNIRRRKKVTMLRKRMTKIRKRRRAMKKFTDITSTRIQKKKIQRSQRKMLQRLMMS